MSGSECGATLTTRSRARLRCGGANALSLVEPEELRHSGSAKQSPNTHQSCRSAVAAEAQLHRLIIADNIPVATMDGSRARRGASFSIPRGIPARSINDEEDEDSDDEDTQSSSKTMPSQYRHSQQQQDHQYLSSFFLPHFASSFILLSLLSVSAIFLIPSFSSSFLSFKQKLPFFSPSVSSRQLLELRDSLALSLHTTASRLEAQVLDLRLQMQEDSRRQHLELQEIRDELHNSKNNILAMPIGDNIRPNVGASSEPLGIASSSGLENVPTITAERPDYALASGGGRIVSHSPAFEVASPTAFLGGIYARFFSGPRLHPLSSIILQPSFNQPGQCLPLAGSDVHVEIALRSPIFPDQVTLTHVSKSIAYDISSAPKEVDIYGSSRTSTAEAPWILLGEFRYDINKGRTAQSFNLTETALATTIKLHVRSNYGSPSHTCIYRVQVHGQEAR